MLSLTVLDAAPGSFTGLFEPMGLATEVYARGLVEASGLVAAVINPRIVASGGEAMIGYLLPVLSHAADPLRAARFAAGLLPAAAFLGRLGVVALEKLASVTLDTVEDATAKHQMRMGIPRLVMKAP
ncbi:hypothetical protein AZSP09_18890 [Azospira sp. I09]|nr:hypothetical protein AZSP09_18890 [Azospira sp. I09]